MTRRILQLALTVCCALVMCGVSRAEGAWLTSWDEAVKQSAKSGKPILMDFTGSDWCGWCIKLKKEVFDTSEFQSWASKNVILLEVDFPKSKPQSDALKKQNQALSEKYGIGGYPTIIFANAKGDVLGQAGYEEGGPKNWIKIAEGQIKKKNTVY